MRSSTGAGIAGVLGLLIVIAVTFTDPSAILGTVAPSAMAPAPAAPAAASGTARAALDALAAHAESDGRLVSCKPGTTEPAPCYTRKLFLPSGWADGSGCDARRDALARQAVADVTSARNGCVLTATIADPYSGARIPSTDADADHVVPLAYAWVHGAAGWDAATRFRFGHDPMNLIAVTSRLNQSKGDSLTWEPPAPGYRCAYVARQLALLTTYRLTLSPAAQRAMTAVLAGCPAQALPTAPEKATP